MSVKNKKPFDRRFLCPECGKVSWHLYAARASYVQPQSGMLWNGTHSCINGHTWTLSREDVGLPSEVIIPEWETYPVEDLT